MSTTGTTPEGSAAPSAGTLAADPGFATLDPETQGYFKNRGLEGKTLLEVAVETSKAHREAEKFVGAPKDLLVRLPKEATDEAGWKAVWQRLGAPQKPEEYDLSAVKDEALAAALRNAFHSEALPKDKAAAIARDVVKFMDGKTTDDLADKTAKLAVEKDALAKSWGPNMEANKFIARQAALKLNLGPDLIDNLEKAAGYEKTMQALLVLGQKLGEDKFVANPNSQTPGVMTREQAMARKAELRNDPDFVKRFNANDNKAVREMDALDMIIAA